jgi:hypothetical protein
VQSFQVTVPSKGPGDHRIVARLVSPAGGVVLHYGDDTVAYGVIDDGTVATSNAIFLDADAAVDGDGSMGSPFNGWESTRDAIAASTRYVYIKGLFSPRIDAPDGGQGDPWRAVVGDTGTRTSETQRLYIRGWPGYEGGIDGQGATDVAGFCMRGSGDFVTFRKLSFLRLETAPQTTRSYFLRTDNRVGAQNFVTAEHLIVNGVLAGKTAATAAWYNEGSVIGYKMWRCSFQNLNKVTTGTVPMYAFESYGAYQVSFQRNTFGEQCQGIYQKETTTGGVDLAGWTVRFNIFHTGEIRVSTQGGRPLYSWWMVQGNVFDSPALGLKFDGSGPDSLKPWIVGNVFYNYQHPTLGAIFVSSSPFTNPIVFNNVFSQINVPIRYNEASNFPEFQDYNHYSDMGKFAFKYLDAVYNSLTEMRSAHPSLGANSVQGPEGTGAVLPDFVDVAGDNFRLKVDSSLRTSGLSGSQMGVFLTGYEGLGSIGEPPKPPLIVPTEAALSGAASSLPDAFVSLGFLGAAYAILLTSFSL